MDGTPRATHGEPNPTLRSLASDYAEAACDAAKKAEKFGQRHRRTHFCVGISAVLAGVVAGTAGIAEGAPILAGIAGFTASALAGMGTRLDAEALARFHFSQGAGYGAISRRFEVLAARAGRPFRRRD